jgi:F0F1-type ATP synthase assembly protein I
MTGDQRPQDTPPGEGGRRELPEPPDPARVDDLRRRLQRDRRERAGGLPLSGVKPSQDTGRRAREIGIYTIIPMMMIVGPALGYLLGLGVERVFGGKPWPSLAGMLWGMLAAFRQVYLILKERGEKPRRRD